MTERLQLAEDRYAAGLDEMSLNVLASPAPERPRRLRPHAAADRGRLARLRRPAWARSRPRSRATRSRCSSPASAGRSRRAARSRPAPSSRATSPPTTATSPRSWPTPTVGDEPLGERARGGARRVRAGGVGGIRRDGRLARARAAAARPRGRRLRARALRPRVALLPRRHGRPRGDLPLGPAGGREPPRPDERDRRRARGRAPASQRGVEILDADEKYQLHGTDALKAWMQERADEVIADLKDVHFDIPGPVAAHRVHDRADADRRHLLHRAVRRLQPARAGCGGRCPRATPSSARGTS